MSAVKYPEIEVQLSGQDGNAFMIIGRVRKALKRAGISNEEAEAFTNEATESDYNNLVATVARWVTVL